MDKDMIERYKSQMLDMYRSAIPQPKTEKPKPAVAAVAPVTEPKPDSMGGLIGIVTSLRNIYPVKGAKVTVFTGNIEQMQVVDTDFTDQSGRTKEFLLKTPEKALSETAGASDKPYSVYNMLVESDGYIDNIHLNIPVFSGVTSLQQSNLMLEETAGEDKAPQIFDESQEFTL